MKHTKRALAILLATLLALGMFSISSAASDWHWYSTIDEMMQDANLVIVGTVTDYDEIFIAGTSGWHIPYTVTSIEVAEVIQGDAQVGDIIEEIRPNHRVPRPYPNGYYVETEWPDIWLEPGQKYLLFLWSSNPPRAWKLNPWQGSYYIDDAGNITARSRNSVAIASLDVLRMWPAQPPRWTCLPNWLQFILRWVLFGWIWM